MSDVLALPTSATTTQASAQVPTGPASGPDTRPRISPAQRQYLRQQSMRILTSGGSEADVVRFLEVEGHKPPPVTITGGDESRNPGIIEGLSMSALQGITFGFGDEVLGGLIGMATGEGWSGGIDAYRKDLEEWSSRHRGLAITAELAGGLATGLGAVRGAKAATSLARSAALGAAGGAASAAGNSTGNISDRTQAALFGAAAGAVFTGVLAGAARTIGAVARPAARNTIAGMTSEELGTALERRIPGLGSSDEHAREVLWRALNEDGITSADVLKDRIATIQATGVPATLADVAGPSTLRLMAEASSQRTPSQLRMAEMFLERQAQSGERISGRGMATLFRGGKMGLMNAYEAVEELATAQRTLAAPLYETAHQQMVTLSPRAQAIMRRPKFKEAWQVARNIGDEEMFAGRANVGALEIPTLPANSRSEQLRTALEGMGVPEDIIQKRLSEVADDLPEALPVRGLDYMKRALDRVIERGRGRGGIDQKEADALRAQLGEVLAEVDQSVPSFGAARTLWRDFETAQASVEVGRDLIKRRVNPALVRSTLAEMSPADRSFARLGMIQHLRDVIYESSNETRDVARDLFGGRLFGARSSQAERIQAFFGDDVDAAREFMSNVAAEARLSETLRSGVRRGRGGSLLQEVEEAAEGTIPNVHMTPARTAAGIVIDGLKRVTGAFRRGIYDDLSLMFTKGIDDPQELVTLAESLEHTGRRVRRGSRGRDAASVVLGARAGGLFRQQN